MNRSHNLMSLTQQEATLTIDVNAIVKNYLLLAKHCSGAKTAAVVKANCYGLGVKTIAPALFKAGCRTFFVATLSEALQLRLKILKTSLIQDLTKIYVFNGVPADKDQAALMAREKIRPVIGSLEELEMWGALCQKHNANLPAALHYDTGMNRLGFVDSELASLKDHPAFSHFSPRLIMSHLACGDTPNHPLNQQQLKKFTAFLALFPDAKASLANSAGIFLGSDYHFDLVRPGIALYGGCPAENLSPNPMHQVAKLEATILKIKTVMTGENIGYGGVQTAQRATKVATLNIGYADGYHRLLGATTEKSNASIVIAGQSFPLLGRVSMDLLTVDITESQTVIKQGDIVEIIGDHITIDDLAAQASTISYEILTNLGNRYHRHYLSAK